VAGCCECGNEPSVSIKCKTFLDKLKNFYLLKASASRGWLVGLCVVTHLVSLSVQRCRAGHSLVRSVSSVYKSVILRIRFAPSLPPSSSCSTYFLVQCFPFPFAVIFAFLKQHCGVGRRAELPGGLLDN
jgi:hypothetical protein